MSTVMTLTCPVTDQVNVITVLIVTLPTRNSGQLLDRSTSSLYSSSLSLHAQGTVVSYWTGQRHHCTHRLSLQGTVVSYWTGQRHHCTHRHSPYMHKEQWSVTGQVNVITVLIVTLPTRNSGQLLDRSTWIHSWTGKC